MPKKKPARRPRAKRYDLAGVLESAVRKDGRSPYAISQAAEIRPEVLTRFLNGERDLKLSTASKLCKVLDLELVAK